MSYPLAESPWGAPIGVYLVLLGISSGISLSFWSVRPRDGAAAIAFEWISGWLAIFLMAVATLILVVELGQPMRFVLMLTELSNLGSAISVGAKLIGLKLYLLGVYLYFLHARARRSSPAAAKSSGEAPPGSSSLDSGLFRVLGSLLGLVSLGLAFYPAALLSRTWVSPLASGPGASAIFLATALTMGVAVAVILAHTVPAIRRDAAFATRIGRTLLFFVGAEIIVLLFEGLALHGSTGHLSRSLDEILEGRVAPAFWSLVVGVGLVGPGLGLLAFPRSRHAAVACAAGTLIGACTTRYIFFAFR